MDVSANFSLTGGLFKNKAPSPQNRSGLSCVHLRSLKNDEMIRSYELLYSFYVACTREGSAKRKVKECICRRCEKTASQNLKSSSELPNRKLFRIHAIHACLSCVFFGCFKDKCHIREHSKKKKHLFAMDTDCGQVYCFACDDYKYDIDFIRIAEEQSAIAKHKKSEVKSKVKPVAGKLEKWEPSPELIAILKSDESDIVYNSETGIRGLFNIGNYTCYLNVIVQCLIHAPIFRDYLLSFQHKCEGDPTCMICHMADVVQESFLRKNKPLGLVKVLYGFFKRCQHYARQETQDALDCFKDLIVNFHEDEVGKIVTRDFSSTLEFFSPCPCIIHEMFGFIIQKEQFCHYCKKVTCREEFKSNIDLNQLKATSVTLDECLRSTWKEEMNCDACKALIGCTSRPLTLPYILNICSNQFSYKENRNTFLKYEEILDLSPYILPSWKTNDDSMPEHTYYLFAVVEYDGVSVGNDRSGHYRCYIKKNQDKWFVCDDKVTEPISVNEVLNIDVRLLFYHKKFM